MIKTLYCLIIISSFLFSSSLSAESRDCTDSVIMGVGPQSNPQRCKAGDIVKLSIKRIAELCKFDSAIVCYGEGKRSLCYCELSAKHRKPR